MELRRTPYDDPDVLALTELVQAYYVEIYGGRDRDPLPASHFRPPRGGFWVGYLDGTATAMGGWTFTTAAGGLHDAQIRRMFVHPRVRGRGLGRHVLATLEVDAAAHDATRMVLATGRPQTAALGLYRAAGYADIEAFGFYADQPGVVCLGKELAGLRPTS